MLRSSKDFDTSKTGGEALHSVVAPSKILCYESYFNCTLFSIINASEAVTLLEQRPEKMSVSERDSNPRPLRCQCSALPTEHCIGTAEVVSSNPAQSLKFFSGLCSSSVTAALALMTVSTQLLLWDKLPSPLLYLGQI